MLGLGLEGGCGLFQWDREQPVVAAMVGLQQEWGTHGSLMEQKLGLLVLGIAFLGLNLLFQPLEIGSSESHFLGSLSFSCTFQGDLT